MVGFSIPSDALAKALPICANCTKTSGRTSALAPVSKKTVLWPPSPGRIRVSAGRFTPLMRPIPKVAAVSTAPVEPAEKRPSASPALTAWAALTILASFFCLTALAGCSLIAITSVVTKAFARSCLLAKRVTNSSAPARRTSSSLSFSRAIRTPSRTTSGLWSDPITSTQITGMLTP